MWPRIGANRGNPSSYIWRPKKRIKSRKKYSVRHFLRWPEELAAIEVHETLKFEDDEKDRVQPLVEKLEAFCIPQKNVTHTCKRHVFNLKNQKPDQKSKQNWGGWKKTVNMGS